MIQQGAAVAAARLGRREGIETLVHLCMGECLKISPGTQLRELLGGDPGFSRYGHSMETWWAAVRDRIRFVPQKAIWTVAEGS